MVRYVCNPLDEEYNIPTYRLFVLLMYYYLDFLANHGFLLTVLSFPTYALFSRHR